MDDGTFDPLRWGMWLFVAIGAVALVGAAIWLQRRMRIVRAGGRAQGTVVDTKGSSSSSGSRTYRPVVEFQTPDGRSHRVVGSTGTGGGDPMGRKMRVAYDPANPDRAFLNTFVQGWLGPLCLAIFGAGFFGLGMMALQVFDYTADDAALQAQAQEMMHRLQAEAAKNGMDVKVETKSSQGGLDLPAEPIQSLKR